MQLRRHFLLINEMMKADENVIIVINGNIYSCLMKLFLILINKHLKRHQ